MINLKGRNYTIPSNPYFKGGKHAGVMKVVPLFLSTIQTEGPMTYKQLQTLSKSKGYDGQQVTTLAYLRDNGLLKSSGRPMKLSITPLGKVYLKAVGLDFEEKF